MITRETRAISVAYWGKRSSGELVPRQAAKNRLYFSDDRGCDHGSLMAANRIAQGGLGAGNGEHA